MHKYQYDPATASNRLSTIHHLDSSEVGNLLLLHSPQRPCCTHTLISFSVWIDWVGIAGHRKAPVCRNFAGGSSFVGGSVLLLVVAVLVVGSYSVIDYAAAVVVVVVVSAADDPDANRVVLTNPLENHAVHAPRP